MNEITTKKDVNEILADSKSLTQYLEDVMKLKKICILFIRQSREWK